MDNKATQSVSNVEITTLDQVRIRGLFYQANDVKGVLIIAGATGVPQGFYKHFARAANEKGFHVLTFDYRGIGQSAPSSLKGYQVNYLDWARHDLAAAIRWAKSYALPICIVGHSYGGHAVGLLPNHEDIQGAYVFGAGAGWAGWMPRFERLKVRLMWNVIAPVIVAWKGYLAWSMLGMGEDLPKRVYQQWKHWCGFPHYFFDDPAMVAITAQFARYDKSLIAANAKDDKWAQPASRDAFFKGYTNADLETKTLNPKQFGLKQIDHMGYFRAKAANLWVDVFEWADKICSR